MKKIQRYHFRSLGNDHDAIDRAKAKKRAEFDQLLAQRLRFRKKIELEVKSSEDSEIYGNDLLDEKIREENEENFTADWVKVKNRLHFDRSRL